MKHSYMSIALVSCWDGGGCVQGRGCCCIDIARHKGLHLFSWDLGYVVPVMRSVASSLHINPL
jgi:hypothetical protein